MNKEVLAATKVNQWKSTNVVIAWFKSIQRKRNCKFIKFDIVDFYPSISEELFSKAVNYARDFIEIEDKVVTTILNARKCFLFKDGQPWTKKKNAKFDVTMGSYDGAEVCELVGLYLLPKIAKILGGDSVGLYRDDGLGYLKGKSKVETERIRKQLHKLFKDEGLSITCETNLDITDFLDVTFDMKNDKYYPYNKPGNTPQYVHHQSNHPPSIIKQIPEMIAKRLSDISSDEQQFNTAAPLYQEALRQSGYNNDITFRRPTTRKRRRSRKIIWFNPPYNVTVKTDIGKKFIQLIKHHFPRHHRYHKIFNTNTIKLSYSCSPSMESIINKHNRKVLNKMPPQEVRCNCRNKKECPLDGKCLMSNIVYRADVISDIEKVSYVGLTEGPFKERFRNHKKTFNNRKYVNDSELSKHVWSLKDSDTNFRANWSVVKRASAYACGSKKCDLCLTEKTIIGRSAPKEFINKKSEIVSKCRHKNKFTLKYGVT